ncbi:conserved hypothetical protein [Imperialibacter sp. EC-SDR9]|nr:conserved hypothetical protein [Imperialibacter sp. 75]CAD5252124.1 conserved hypothetical protein [Imperialibacter sp. 89]VVT32000.1 conserved hypothetical protein [Imperialibacter sp. EC-SDR9]
MTRYLDMGFPTKIQLIKRAKSEQWYINFPAAVAQAMEFEKGEVVEWVVEDKQKMTLKRLPTQQGNEVKKKLL